MYIKNKKNDKNSQHTRYSKQKAKVYFCYSCRSKAISYHPYGSMPILFTTLMKSFFLEINVIFIPLVFKKESISIF